MPEKPMVTIDSSLDIPEGKEKTVENQHIRLEAGIKCGGKLIFRNCTIEPCASVDSGKGRRGRNACKPGCVSMSSNSELEMDGCEVIRPGRDFLSGFGDMIIKNTSFLNVPCADNEGAAEAFATQCVIAAHGEKRFEHCSFVGDTGNAPQASELALIKCGSAIMGHCTFKNITGKIEVDTIADCSFTDCASIEGVEISGSTFTDCKSISADNGYFRKCDFIHVGTIFATSSDIDGCRFQKIRGDVEDDGVISLEDCKIIHSSFDDVELRNNAYLISGAGDFSVEDCQFENCYTDREDGEFCHCEEGASASTSLPMGLLKGALKLAGSAALGTAGVAATFLRQAAVASGNDTIADLAGTIQDSSFEKVRDMWTPDDKKDEAYCEAQAERSERRAASAVSGANQFQRRREEERKKLKKSIARDNR